jgi:hypothetical protein
MGGSVLISKGNGVVLSSRDFDYIIEKIRPYFPSNAHLFRDEIYDPVDEGGMSFLSLMEQNEKGVEAFFYAATSAFEHETEEERRSLEKTWNELFNAIKSDSRFGNGRAT